MSTFDLVDSYSMPYIIVSPAVDDVVRVMRKNGATPLVIDAYRTFYDDETLKNKALMSNGAIFDVEEKSTTSDSYGSHGRRIEYICKEEENGLSFKANHN